MAHPPRSQPSDFQLTAAERLKGVLERHGMAVGDFHLKEGRRPTLWTSFRFDGRDYDLAIFHDDINMREGSNLYETYLSREYRDAATLIDSFAIRLDRFLSNGRWEGPDE